MASDLYALVWILSALALHYFPTKYHYIIPIHFGYITKCIGDMWMLGDQFEIHENVIPMFGFIYMITFLIPMHWKTTSLIFTGWMIYFGVMANIKFERVPNSLSFCLVSTSLYFTIRQVLLTYRLRSMYEHMFKYEKLSEEKEKLFQVFPNGVLIHSFTDDSHPEKVLFTNDEFKSQIQDIRNKVDELDNIQVSYFTDEEHLNERKTDLHQYLNEEQKQSIGNLIRERNRVKFVWSPGVLREEGGYQLPDQKKVTSEGIFNIKSMQVEWEGEKCLMHVFINQTDIVKLEEAKNNIKCQKIMFASVSHEFRTPLNAIVHSYQFVLDNSLVDLQNLWSSVKHFLSKKQNEDFSRSIERIQNTMKMGKNSSQILLSLVEDILDLSKMEAGIFTMNYSTFRVRELINEIYDFFIDQWQRKNLILGIDLDDIAKDISISSDKRR